MSIILGNLVFDLSASIYKPREDSYLLLEISKNEFADKSAMEIGCGTGLSILSLAKISPESSYLATDLNYHAANLTAKNAKSNQIDNCMIVCTDLMSSFRKGGTPKNILFNPPYLPADPIDKFLSTNEKIMYVGGDNGYELSSMLISQLEDDHIILIILSSLASTPKEFSNMHPDWNMTVETARKLTDGETLWIIKCVRCI